MSQIKLLACSPRVWLIVCSSPDRVTPKDYKIGMCCFSAKHAALRGISKDWFTRNLATVSMWGDMSISGLLLQ